MSILSSTKFSFPFLRLLHLSILNLTKPLPTSFPPPVRVQIAPLHPIVIWVGLYKTALLPRYGLGGYNFGGTPVVWIYSRPPISLGLRHRGEAELGLVIVTASGCKSRLTREFRTGLDSQLSD